jgi:hypothetical protein
VLTSKYHISLKFDLKFSSYFIRTDDGAALILDPQGCHRASKNGQNIEPIEDRLANKYSVNVRRLILIDISYAALKAELYCSLSLKGRIMSST